MTNSENAQRPTEVVSEPRNDGRCKTHGLLRTVTEECRRCRGEGSVWVTDDPGMSDHYERCWECHGTGTDPFLNCPMCLEEEYDDL